MSAAFDDGALAPGALPAAPPATNLAEAFAATPGTPLRLVFTGRGSEYFRIWAVNLFLSMVTLGIYSAWAKVRRTHYFYDNTSLDGVRFAYHGNPISILKGRVLALLLILGYTVSKAVSLKAGLIALAVLLLIMPLLVQKSLQFKLHNSSFRGIRFGFMGSLAGVYLYLFFLPLLAVCSLGLASPLAHQRMKKYLFGNARFGTTRFAINVTVGAFYRIYLICLAALAGVAVAAAVILGLSGDFATVQQLAAGKPPKPDVASLIRIFACIVALYLWIIMVATVLMKVLIHNLVWNNAQLGAHRFKSSMRWTMILWLGLSNVVAIVLSFGMFVPFAQMRMMRYQLETLTLIPAGNLDTMLAGADQTVAASGEGAADLFAFDLGL
jgi:uncharacterized membrane protein YjgN (DUF898 family)